MNNNENIDINRILSRILTKKVIFSVILIMIICILMGYFYSYYYQKPIYKSSSTIFLAGDVEEKEKVTISDIYIGNNLISTYSNIVKSSKVVKKTIENLGLNTSVGGLKGCINVNEITETQVIEVSVVNSNPKMAMIITNELIKVFIEEIKEIYELDNISIVDKAEVPTVPYNINHTKDMLKFIALGIVLSAITIFIIYILDNTIKDGKDIEDYLKTQLIATVPLIDKNDELPAMDRKISYAVECLKNARTNILYSANISDTNILLLTSTRKAEGKSWIANNLAIEFAQTGKNVLIVDCNLIKASNKAQLFCVQEKEGLSDFLNKVTNNQLDNLEIACQYIQETNIPNLHILTHGTILSDPSSLLTSKKMETLLHLLRNMYDLVILDSAPCMPSLDGIALAAMSDITVLVAENRKTKIHEIKNVISQIKDADGNLIGVILNKDSVRGKSYYGYGYYYGRPDEELKDLSIENREIRAVSLLEIIENAKVNIERELVEDEVKQEEVEIIEEVEVKEENTFGQISKKIKKLVDRVLKIEEKFHKKEKNDKDKDKKIAELMNKIEKMQKIQEDNKVQVEEQINKIIDNNIKEQEDTNNKLMQRIATIDKKYGVMGKEIANQMVAMRNESADLEEKIIDTDRKYDNMSSEIARHIVAIKDENNELEKKITDTDKKYGTMSKEIAKHMVSIKNKNAELSGKVNSIYEMYEFANEKVSRQILEMKNENVELTGKINKVDEEISNQILEIKSKNNELTEKVNYVESANREIAENVENVNARFEDKVNKAREEIAGQMELLRNESANTILEISDVKKENQEKIQKIMQENDSLRKEIAQMKEENVNINWDVAQIKQRNEAIDKEIKDAKKLQEDANSELMKKINEREEKYKASNEEIASKILEMRNKNTELTGKVNYIDEKYESVNREISNQILAIKIENSRFAENINSITEKYEVENKDIVNNIESINAEFTQRINEAIEDMSSKMDLLKDENVTISEFSELKKENQENMQKIMQENADLQQEIARMKDENSKINLQVEKIRKENQYTIKEINDEKTRISKEIEKINITNNEKLDVLDKKLDKVIISNTKKMAKKIANMNQEERFDKEYEKLLNKMKSTNKNETPASKIVHFETLKKKTENVFSIYEDIKYEDLEKLSTCTIDLTEDISNSHLRKMK